MENENNNITKKRGKDLVIIISVLVIVILSLICYICYDKGIIFNSNKTSTTKTTEKEKNDSPNKNEEKEKEKEENITFSDSELETYVNYISPVSNGPSALIYNTDHISSKNLSPAKKIEYIGSHIYSKHTSTPDFQYDIISENDIKNEIEKIYGKNSYERTSFNLGCGDYNLNQNEGNYYSKTGCGGSNATFVSNIVIDYKATKKKLEITTVYAFIDGMENKIYKDYNKSIPLDNYTDGNVEPTTFLNEYIKNNKDKLNRIVYTFESNDGINYYFKEFTNNK